MLKTTILLLSLSVAFTVAAQAEIDLSPLSAGERAIYTKWKRAYDAYETVADGYWSRTVALRKLRREKSAAGEALTRDDYVLEQPPVYDGPKEPTKILAKLKTKDREKAKNPKPVEPILALSAYVEAAEEVYGFAPDIVSERQFKRNYAAEALRLGFTADQIVRVYALETGGLGTFDMQSGLNPVTRKGRPISTAVGYAQLVDANSVDAVVQHGERMAKRLLFMAAEASGARSRRLEAKARILLRMREDALSVPQDWLAHKAYAQKRKGMALHALNLDADIGPWMQVQKLDDTRRFAERKGKSQLSGAELEIMNLAGPQSGFEMQQRLARDLPTANFFERRGYERNSIVRGRTAGELLADIARRMEAHLDEKGAVEFLEVFRELGEMNDL
ncbi:MAG: hypothetical protein R3D57_11065 [Hyphomicrobiaceae bacterium]